MNDVEICNTTKNELKSFAVVVVVVMMLQFTGPNKKQKDKTEAVTLS